MMMRQWIGKVLVLGLLVLALGMVVFSAETSDDYEEYQPSQTNTSDYGGYTAPYADAPKCTDHDPNAWHSLWNPAKGCYYDHEHKHNPGIIYEGMPEYERREAQAMLNIFGPPGKWFGGGAISYPWQTFVGSNPWSPTPPANAKFENQHKHGGYGWLVRYDIPQYGAGDWIRDFRVQYHAIFAVPGTTTRYHSFSLEANVCAPNADCRIIRTGGWIDFGHLIINGKVAVGNEGGNSARRLHYEVGNTHAFAGDQYLIPTFWYGTFAPHERLPWDADRPFRAIVLGLASKDVWINTRSSSPYWNDFFCPDFQCNKNGSTIQAHLLQINLLQNSFDGYVDRYGNSVEGCTAVSLDCIPTIVEEGSTFFTEYRDDTSFGYDALGQREFDISPPGVWWIDFPN